MDRRFIKFQILGEYNELFHLYGDMSPQECDFWDENLCEIITESRSFRRIERERKGLGSIKNIHHVKND
jgi:hypothetical protein